MLTRRLLSFAPLWCAALIACGTSPGDSDPKVSSTEQAATFPATDAGWFPLRQQGFGLGDIPTDANGDHREIIGDATNPAMFYYVDDTHFFVRMRLQGDPAGPGILKSFGWGLVFDTDTDPSDWEYGVIVDGVGESISFVQNTIQATLGDPSDKAEVTLSSEPTSIAAGGNLQITVIDPPLVVSGNDTQDWFLDFAIPLRATAPAQGLYDVLTPDQTLQVIGGTSNNAASLDLDLAGCDNATSIACALSDEIEVDPDLDNDGVPNFRDLDDDNDGLPDTLENDLGLDPDGDHDGDGVLNWRDAHDRGDGQPNLCVDVAGVAGNGVCDVAAVLFDDDGDGRPNHRDLDADNDAIVDSVEAGHRGPDVTFRGMVDGAVGTNGLPDAVETAPDSGVINYPVLRSDFEGAPDVRDLDSDGDGVFDLAEVGAQAFDTNSDGRVELQPTVDYDGLQTAVDRDPAQFGYPGIQPRTFDADADGIPDPFDRVGGTSGGDGDGDSVSDSAECVGGWVCPDGDADGYPDYIESSDLDGDGVADDQDDAPADPFDCRDQDGDGCDDCSVTGANGSGGSVTNDGLDTDADGICDVDELDNDSDGIVDALDPAPTDPDLCGDSDGDSCDDCAVGTDDLGPLSDSLPGNDGTDTDGDGTCDAGEAPDTDGDGVVDPADAAPTDPNVCRNLDGDACDDCAVTGADGSGGDVANDGPDADSDGQCDTASAPDLDEDGIPDATDLDDDNDGILDAEELRGDADDLDADGVTNDRDLDSDGDGITDVEESGGAGQDVNGDGKVDGGAGANGVPDAAESSPESGMVTTPVDSDGDGTADYRDRDSDGDTISDKDEAGDADLGTPPVDTDDDGLPDYLDLDSDSDQIDDADEAGDDEIVTPPVDTDGDGTPDFRDLDSDNDGKPDVDEGGGPGNDTGPLPDFDQDGTPDFQDPDSYGLQGGGCAAGGNAGSGTGGLVLLGALGAVLSRRRRRALAALVAAPVVLGATTAAAQSAGLVSEYPVERARFNANSDGVLDVDWGGVLPHLTIDGGLFVSLSDDPLNVYRGTDDGRERVGSLVSQRLGGELAAAIGLLDRFELGFSVPLILSQSQDTTGLMASSVDGFGLGDLRVFGKVAVLEQDTHLVNGAVFVRVALPSSTSSDYFGDASGVVEPGIAVSRAFGRSLRATTTLLYRLRDRQEALDLVVDDEIAFDAGLGYRFASTPVELTAAFGLATSASDASAFNTNYSEGKLGAQYDIPGPLAVFAGAGMGLAEGWGTPDWRVLAGMRFVGERPGEAEPPARPLPPPPPVEADDDIDGLVGAADACPTEPETLNGYNDTDGCPDELPDGDGDGLADGADTCPAEAEDKDGFQDDDGCADLDNDGDGVADANDRCPLEAGVVAMAGCPDPDRDGDGVVDRVDNCPTEAGTADHQGCATPQLVQIVDGKLALIESVYFKTDRAVIESKSLKLLTNVAQVLASHPTLRVRVEGHTDSKGNPAYNQGLSQRRAEAVVAFLVKAGVDAGRLEAQGYGDTQPVADNKTVMGRATNRRVVFTMLEGGAGVTNQQTGPGAETIDR